MKLLVTGSQGMLGRAVMRGLAAEHDVVGIDVADGDLTCPQTTDTLWRKHAPQWVIHCAAWTDVDGAESAAQAAMAVNATATEHVAAACRRVEAGLTYISTDYVFSGQALGGGYDEDAPRSPINTYGQTKARGEEIVEALDTPWQIVRTSWLFGDGPTNFPKTIGRLLTERDVLNVVDDQQGCPTYADDLAQVLGVLVSSGRHGIFHGTNQGICTWFEFAREVARLCSADPDRIRPCPSHTYPTVAQRPTCSVLRSRNLEAAGCPERPTWTDALARYLKRLKSGAVDFP